MIVQNDGTVGGGGGIHCRTGAAPTVVSSIIAANTSDQYGGGIYMILNGRVTLVHCTVAGNVLLNPGSSPLGSAAAVSGSILDTIRNCIIWGNMPANSPLTLGMNDVVHSDVQGGWQGTGNIDADPLFVNPAALDFHIFLSSPCRDAGSAAVPGIPALDIDGQNRIGGTAPDMGADETEWVSLELSQPFGSGSLRLRNTGTYGGKFYLTAVSFDPLNAGSGLGTGWWAGLHISIQILGQEIMWGEPFVGFLDAGGASNWELPAGTVPVPFTPIYAVTRIFDPLSNPIADSNLVSLVVN